MSNTVVLVGPMGAGKSSVGRRLAARLGFEFADTDAEIERRTGVDIPYIFEREGEPGFRQREAQVLSDWVGKPDTVLATGGGIIVTSENIALLAAHAPVVYLHASVAQQFERVRHGKHRPLLAGDDPKGTLTRLFETRDPVYREVADLFIDTDGERVERVARRIEQQLLETQAD